MHLIHTLRLTIFSVLLGLVLTAGTGPQLPAVDTQSALQPGKSLTPRSPFLVSPSESPETAGAGLQWYKGNTHTHTINADGDSTPDEVVRWYREHNGYQFMVLTDHDLLTPVDALNASHGVDGEFLVIAGEEVTDRFEKKAVHLNGLLIRRVVAPQGGISVADVLQRDTDAIRKAGGVPTINHPNYKWAITADDVRQVSGAKLFEIFSGNPDVNDMGGGGSPGVEDIWDSLLSSGHEIYGIAVDDAHEFKRPWDPRAKRPGLGWVVVRAAALEPRAIVAALDRGEFYASNGVELERIVVTPQSLTVSVKPNSWRKGRIQFIGRGGKLLKEAIASPASYEFIGDEGYVRARAIDSNGRIAWVQPVFLSSTRSK